MKSYQLVSVAMGCAAANFITQAVGDGQWSVALERSYFQALAVLAVYLCTRITARLTA